MGARNGFTLVEVLLAMILLAIFVAGSVSILGSDEDQRRYILTMDALRTIKKGLEAPKIKTKLPTLLTTAIWATLDPSRATTKDWQLSARNLRASQPQPLHSTEYAVDINPKAISRRMS